MSCITNNKHQFCTKPKYNMYQWWVHNNVWGLCPFDQLLQCSRSLCVPVPTKCLYPCLLWGKSHYIQLPVHMMRKVYLSAYMYALISAHIHQSITSWGFPIHYPAYSDMKGLYPFFQSMIWRILYPFVSL